MTAVVAHRGPDADGFYVAPGLGLGHRRLSIIDLSTGDQPLANEDGTVWVVFNGEIYNFMEIRSELERAGHRFRTGTDTEVIVHAYEQWGEEAVHRFRGMFAFGALGRAAAPAAAGARPARHQAAVLRRHARRRHVRFGNQVAARGSGRAERLERRGAGCVSRAPVRARPANDLPSHPQAPRRSSPRRRGRARRPFAGTGI